MTAESIAKVAIGFGIIMTFASVFVWWLTRLGQQNPRLNWFMVKGFGFQIEVGLGPTDRHTDPEEDL